MGKPGEKGGKNTESPNTVFVQKLALVIEKVAPLSQDGDPLRIGDMRKRIDLALVQVAAAEIEPDAGGNFLAVGAAADPVRAFDHAAGDAVPRQFLRRRQPGGAGTDDNDVRRR